MVCELMLSHLAEDAVALHAQRHKTVVLEELASEFGLRTQVSGPKAV
jgi:hypothetical protein